MAQRTRRLLGSLSNINTSTADSFGTGGRSSVSGLKVAIFGGTGFLGRYVTNEFGQVGSVGYIANRGCEMETRHLKPMFDLGNAAFYLYSPRDEESVSEIIEDADVVVNMIGKRYETKHVFPTNSEGQLDTKFGSRINYGFKEVNVDIAARIARIAANTPSVKQLIHVSALAADPNSNSEWARTKYEGELAVREAFPGATIIRPATLFGVEDRFINWYATNRKVLVNDGKALVQPVHAVDVAMAIKKICDDPETLGGKTYELAGPQEYSRAEIVDFVRDVTEQRNMKDEPFSVPKPLLKGMAHALEYFWDPSISHDEVELMDIDTVLKPESDALTFADLKMTPSPIEKICFNYLYQYRTGSHFLDAPGYH